VLKSKIFAWIFSGLVFLIFSVSLFAADEVTYDAGKRRDPFIPLNPEDADLMTSSGVKLEGIIYDPGNRSMVILNGKTYQAGEAVGDATVVKILRDHVVISEGEEEKTLWIREEEKT